MTALTPDLLQRMDAYWRAANYLSVGQIYLFDNPLLERPLTLADVKHMLLGHWGTTPGQNVLMNEAMAMALDMDRFHLVMDVIDRVPQAGARGIALKQELENKRTEHKRYINQHGQDMPEIRNWKWRS